MVECGGLENRFPVLTGTRVRIPYSPLFLEQKGFDEEFYIRIGPSSAGLEIREALKYISERFEKKI